jgi:hypothetical protein
MLAGDKQTGANKPALARELDDYEKKRRVQETVSLQTNAKLRPTETECTTVMRINHPGTGKVSELQQQSSTQVTCNDSNDSQTDQKDEESSKHECEGQSAVIKATQQEETAANSATQIAADQSSSELNELGQIEVEDATDEEAMRLQGRDMMDQLRIEPVDYETDENFAAMWNYLKDNRMTQNDKINYKTVLLSDQYLIKENLLYKLSLPTRKRKNQELKLLLVVPKKFENLILSKGHGLYGHSATEKLYNLLNQYFYFSNLFTACHDVEKYAKFVKKRKYRPEYRFLL